MTNNITEITTKKMKKREKVKKGNRVSKGAKQLLAHYFYYKTYNDSAELNPFHLVKGMIEKNWFKEVKRSNFAIISSEIIKKEIKEQELDILKENTKILEEEFQDQWDFFFSLNLLFVVTNADLFKVSNNEKMEIQGFKPIPYAAYYHILHDKEEDSLWQYIPILVVNINHLNEVIEEITTTVQSIVKKFLQDLQKKYYVIWNHYILGLFNDENRIKSNLNSLE